MIEPADLHNKESFRNLKKEVYDCIHRNGLSPKRTRDALVKSLFLWVLWFILYAVFLVGGKQGVGWAILLSFPWAFVMLVIQLSVMHDGSHGASSDSLWFNRVLTSSISFLGGSALLWKEQHCRAHHSFTNVYNYDHDIDTHGLLRLHPSQKFENHHKYQHIYAWFLYPLFILHWIWWGDFRDIISNTYSISSKKLTQAVIEIILSKTWHIFFFIAVPVFTFGSVWVALFCYLLSFMILGFCMVIIFQLAHVTGLQEFPGSLQNHKGWVWRQVSTTANFSIKNYLLTWCTGGLNFQIEHHLFPSMSHLNYPLVQPIVKDYCLRNHLPYLSQDTLYSAVIAHQTYLKKMGTKCMGREKSI